MKLLSIGFLIRAVAISIAFISTAAAVQGQHFDAAKTDQGIEDAVVRSDVRFLNAAYADDFRFTHGDGQVQTKAEWLTDVRKREFVSRKVSALESEVHGDVAITTGRLDVVWRGEGKEEIYALRFVRVYERRKGRWLLLSHRTVQMLSS